MYVDAQGRTLRKELSTCLPREFRDFRGYHSGETLLVCGCGSSLSQVVAPERVVTIGVNDVGRLFDPDYLVVLNPRQQFTGDRFRYVEQSRARAVFSQLELGIAHPHQVRLQLGRRGGTDFSDPDVLPYTRNSPYPALCLAVHMGAKRIGLIGVDFTDHHFFAPTGRHPLAGEFAQIDEEYRQFQKSCECLGVQVLNLSAESRLTAFPKTSPEDFVSEASCPGRFSSRKVFFVHHSFVTCGNVFQQGLAHAADHLGLKHSAARWDDSQLEQKVEHFNPDLLLVVNGRLFCRRFGNRFAKYESAVWLLDEPYEVDDTSGFSGLFGTVFVNDPSTLSRHRNSHYLPACYDPKEYFYLASEQRPHSVGFIGFSSPHREEALGRLARRELLSYVVGGPWNDSWVNRFCKTKLTSPQETATLYRNSRIVVNLFRSRHHYNNAKIPAFALNPRVYEAVACGALAVCEYRPELDVVCPEMPAFSNLDEMEDLIDRHLRDQELYVRARRACIRKLAMHTYAARLAYVVKTCLSPVEATMQSAANSTPEVQTHALVRMPNTGSLFPLPAELAGDWELDGDCVGLEPDGSLLLQRPLDESPGSERGLVGKATLQNLIMDFDVYLQADSTFIAKIHQVEGKNHLANSYHLMCRGASSYLARHHHVFNHLVLPLNKWFHLSFSYLDGAISVRKDGALLAQAQETTLESGHCFLGIKGGTVKIRNISARAPGAAPLRRKCPDFELLIAGREVAPRVSIITTVYDRVECLERCLASVKALHFKDCEQIVVADAPPPEILRQIEDLVIRNQDSGKLTLATLKQRRNDWGISPASAGLTLAHGKYVCFLSDDNGYVPTHFDKLVPALDANPTLGFVYCSCLYAGRAVLRTSAPRPAAIDLGQPLFRRELFERYLGGGIPFHEFGWDWRMIESFLRSGVQWQHVDDATFVFRLANYPHLMPGQSEGKTA